jgi:hypothetical protein
LREKYCWLVAGGWFVLREKYCWMVTDKPSEQSVIWDMEDTPLFQIKEQRNTYVVKKKKNNT